MTQSSSAVDSVQNEFLLAFRGSFQGILRWPQLDQLWQTVFENKSTWYIYAIGQVPPPAPVDLAQLQIFIEEIDRLLRREHDEDYCGLVYTDNIQDPTFIKIFDPNNVGTSCGTATTPPLPGWILSTIKPVDLPEALLLASTSQPNNRKRWWNKLFE